MIGRPGAERAVPQQYAIAVVLNDVKDIFGWLPSAGGCICWGRRGSCEVCGELSEAVCVLLLYGGRAAGGSAARLGSIFGAKARILVDHLSCPGHVLRAVALPIFADF
jgi:hypothetical protein